ncbi:MAG: hypothetical protein OWS74_06945 [Firmicutes bacterium]|nr:hypothetical protein [Bacillota bacterium]
MSKKPISFQDKLHERKNKIRTRRPSSSSASSAPRADDNDFLIYWSRILRNPLQLSGRGYWTERMLWSNGAVAGIIVGLHYLFIDGIHILLFLAGLVNILFFTFIFYYTIPWMVTHILPKMHRKKRRIYSSDMLKRELIVLSGWFVLYALAQWIPWHALLITSGLALLLGIEVIRAIRYTYRTSWLDTIVSGLVGFVGYLALVIIINSLFAI